MDITDPAMVRSLVREEAATYLAPFLHEDHSVSEAAGLLHVSVQKMHYWVRSLYDAGLVEVVAETRRKGRSIKRYRAIADEFVVPAEVLPSGHFERVMRRSNAEMTDALVAAAPEWVLSGDFRIHASSPQRGSRDRILREGTDFGAVTHQSTCTVRITENEARRLAQEMGELRDRWIARSQDGSDLPPYQLNIALAPVPD